MITVHFTKLYDYASRDIDLADGLEYVLCHRQNGYSRSDAQKVMLASGVTYLHPCTALMMRCKCQSPNLPASLREDPFGVQPFIAYYQPDYFDSSMLRVKWSFAADRGLWNVPGIDYLNTVNYMLNVRTLATMDIEIGGV